MDSIVLLPCSGERNDLVDIPLVLVSPDIFAKLIGLEFVVYKPPLAHAVTLSPSKVTYCPYFSRQYARNFSDLR
jgi:hypothetical protein